MNPHVIGRKDRTGQKALKTRNDLTNLAGSLRKHVHAVISGFRFLRGNQLWKTTHPFFDKCSPKSEFVNIFMSISNCSIVHAVRNCRLFAHNVSHQNSRRRGGGGLENCQAHNEYERDKIPPQV